MYVKLTIITPESIAIVMAMVAFSASQSTAVAFVVSSGGREEGREERAR